MSADCCATWRCLMCWVACFGGHPVCSTACCAGWTWVGHETAWTVVLLLVKDPLMYKSRVSFDNQHQCSPFCLLQGLYQPFLFMIGSFVHGSVV